MVLTFRKLRVSTITTTGFDPGINESHPAAWFRIADFKETTKSTALPKGNPSVMKSFSRYSDDVSFLGWDPDTDHDPNEQQFRPLPREKRFRDLGCGPDPHIWCGGRLPTAAPAVDSPDKSPDTQRLLKSVLLSMKALSHRSRRTVSMPCENSPSRGHLLPPLSPRRSLLLKKSMSAQAERFSHA